MDIKSLSELLKGTLDPNHRNEAEKKLTEVHKIIGFGPVLLQVIMSSEVELPVRQAAVIYLKNMVRNIFMLRIIFQILQSYRLAEVGLTESQIVRERVSRSPCTSRTGP